jgi:hypothetical protein
VAPHALRPSGSHPLTSLFADGPPQGHLILLVIRIIILIFNDVCLTLELISRKNHKCGPILEASGEDGVRGCIRVILSLNSPKAGPETGFFSPLEGARASGEGLGQLQRPGALEGVQASVGGHGLWRGHGPLDLKQRQRQDSWAPLQFQISIPHLEGARASGGGLDLCRWPWPL